MDVDVDSTCRKHAQGMEIPINKGGERVRSRISFPDGSAAFIKYDTRVTAKCNGSIKLVRKDRTTILAKDDGTVTFHPSTTWTNEDEEKYLEDCKIDDLDPNDSRIKGRSATTAFPFSALPTSGTNGFGSVAPPPAISRNSNHGTNETLPPALISKRRGSPPTAVRSSRRSPDRSTTTSSRSPVLGAMTGHNVFASNHEPDVVISINLIRGTCVIKDYEFNSFEIDLAPQPAPAVIPEPSTESVSAEIIEPSLSVATDSVVSPLDVKVELAGEVPGLKPPAVARSPKPPRLYTISRTGEATEVLSIQEVRLFEHQAKINSDVTKYSSPAVLPPNELGPAYSWRYFTEKRYFSSYFHGFSFQEIFGTRYYHSIKIPAATLNFLYTKPTLHYRKENEVGDAEPGRIFESISLIEKLPISQEGYSQITVSIQKCEEFRQQRVLSIDRFAVEDPRPPEQIKEEEEITKRLKQVYKLAKINAAKKKAKGGDDDGDDDVSQANSAVKAPLSARSTGSNQSPSAKEYKPSKGNETIKEGDNEDEDDDQADEDDHFGSDDEDGEPDPEEAAVRAVFDDFSSQSEVEGFLADVIPVASLQEAFVRILNQFISQDLIEKAILDTDEVDVNLEEFTFQEFRLIFVSLQKQLQLSEEQKTFDETPYTPYAVDQYVDENDDSPLRPYSTKGISEDARSFPSSRTRESYFHRENSSNNNTPRNVAKTAPPLNLTGILASAVSKSGGSKTDEDGLPIMDSLFSNESSIAVGQPINAVRRAKTMK